MFDQLKRSWRKFKRGVRRVVIWFIAAAITLAVLFVGVVVYKLTVYKPAPPPQSDCQASDIVTSDDNSAEVHLYQCRRGSGDKAWQGYELWLFEPLVNDWQRLATAPTSTCPTLSWRKHQEAELAHSGSRGDIQLADAVFIYTDAMGESQTISVRTNRRNNDACPSAEQEN